MANSKESTLPVYIQILKITIDTMNSKRLNHIFKNTITAVIILTRMEMKTN